MRAIYKLFLLLFCLFAGRAIADSVVVIGYAELPKLDNVTIRKLFTGRLIEIGGTTVTVVNAAPGSVLRKHFLAEFLNQDEEKYTAYWTVRKFIGLGSPPRELPSSAAIIGYVQSTPGAIGYIDQAYLKPGLNVLSK